MWHGARVAVVVSSTKEDAGGNYVRDLRARTVTAREAADYVRGAFDDRLAWRGNLSLTDAEYKASAVPTISQKKQESWIMIPQKELIHLVHK